MISINPKNTVGCALSTYTEKLSMVVEGMLRFFCCEGFPIRNHYFSQYFTPMGYVHQLNSVDGSQYCPSQVCGGLG